MNMFCFHKWEKMEGLKKEDVFLNMYSTKHKSGIWFYLNFCLKCKKPRLLKKIINDNKKQ